MDGNGEKNLQKFNVFLSLYGFVIYFLTETNFKTLDFILVFFFYMDLQKEIKLWSLQYRILTCSN